MKFFDTSIQPIYRWKGLQLRDLGRSHWRDTRAQTMDILFKHNSPDKTSGCHRCFGIFLIIISVECRITSNRNYSHLYASVQRVANLRFVERDGFFYFLLEKKAFNFMKASEREKCEKPCQVSSRKFKKKNAPQPCDQLKNSPKTCRTKRKL